MDKGSGEKKVEETVYGESQGKATNHRGEVYQTFDQSGKNTIVEYDFKGNPLKTEWTPAQDYKNVLDWSGSVALKNETFTHQTTYDALDRPVTIDMPDNTHVEPGYDDGGRLTTVKAQIRGASSFTDFVTEITFKGVYQRQKST